MISFKMAKRDLGCEGRLKEVEKGRGERWELVVVREDTKAWWDIPVCLSVGFLLKSDSTACVCV